MAFNGFWCEEEKNLTNPANRARGQLRSTRSVNTNPFKKFTFFDFTNNQKLFLRRFTTNFFKPDYQHLFEKKRYNFETVNRPLKYQRRGSSSKYFKVKVFWKKLIFWHEKAKTPRFSRKKNGIQI